MEKYYVVFSIDYSSTKGQELAKILDVDDPLKHLRGFHTKRAMLNFLEEFKSGIRIYQMLKPIT